MRFGRPCVLTGSLLALVLELAALRDARFSALAADLGVELRPALARDALSALAPDAAVEVGTVALLGGVAALARGLFDGHRMLRLGGGIGRPFAAALALGLDVAFALFRILSVAAHLLVDHGFTYPWLARETRR